MNSRTEAISLSHIGVDLIQSIARHLVNFSVGFVKIEQTPRGDDARLAGSGTLVQVEQEYAILTADHVVKELPRRGHLGLVLHGHLAHFSVEAQNLKFIRIARGLADRNGPDIGAVILPREIADSLAAKQIFFHLGGHKNHMLNTPPRIDDGIWLLLGFVDERTTEEAGTGRYDVIKKFVQLALCGNVDQPFARERHDYFDVTVRFGDSTAPRDFRGMSGGGLWQVSLQKDGAGQITHKQAFLSGVPFYQGPVKENRTSVRCHGRRSIYEVVYEALAR